MNTKTTLAILLSFTLFAGCHERLDVNLEDTYPRLIVEGNLNTDDSIQRIKLTKSSSYFDNKPFDPISNARVFITEGTDTLLFTENTNKPGIYETPATFSGIPGRTYKLFIENANVGNGTTNYWSTSYLPTYSKIDTCFLKPILKTDFAPPGVQYAINGTFTDPAETQDNYIFRIYKNGILATDTFTRLTMSRDDFYNGRKIDTTTLYFVMFNYDESGGRQGMVVFPDSLKTGDKIVLEVDGVTKENITFLEDLQRQYDGGNPLFDGPRANVFTNIYPKDKAAGFFSAYIVARDTIIFK